MKLTCSRLLFVTLLTGCFVTPAAPDDADLLDGPIATLTPEQLGIFLRGDEAFARQFGPEDGLGPVFNAGSCFTCHPGDGRGHPEFGFLRFGRDDNGEFDPMIDVGGPQLQDRAVPGASPEVLPGEATGVTLLIAPSMTGLGYLEAVDDQTLLDLADPTDRNRDGVSGRVHWRRGEDIELFAAEADDGGGTRFIEHEDGFIGRFGRRASNVSLLHQAVAAYHQDMGITTDFAPVDLTSGDGNGARDSAADPEVGSGELADVVFYLRTLRVPERRNADDGVVRAGEATFDEIGCATCHVPTLRTGRSSIAALSEQEFHPYTDLLLHDMGPELADDYAENGSAVGEWRTPPLWGIGLATDFTGGELFLMHDGRARSLDEAIRLHGGEGEASRDAYLELDADARNSLIRFLESL